MPTDLQRLRVSLTKHGAHKIAYLIANFNKDEILNNVWGTYQGIHIDRAQASNILSENKDRVVPSIWDEIKKFGEQDIFDLVLIANIFSHVDLINTMIDAIKNDCIIERGRVISGKAYTNFAHTIEQLDFSIEHTPDYISFDISRIFYKFYLTNFIAKIFEIKLIDAGWEQNNTLIEECLNNNFNSVFGLSPEEFEIWLQGALEIEEDTVSKVKAKRNFESGIKFKEGHSTKFEGEISIKQHDRNTATLLHNQIQNKVFLLLSEQFQNDLIGTEIPSNTGSIDIVRKQNEKYFFYEIKTSSNTKTNIRQALSQLIEYAYWNEISDVEALIIIAPSAATDDSIKYLNLLRDRFRIPIFYQYYNINANSLSGMT
jgi:hypothetical protein